jgi:exosortase A-associated hydrolase 2
VKRGSLSGHFLGEPGRRAFVLMREPAEAAGSGGSVLVVPPFGEEMNKSRRMIAETSLRLCEAGWTVALPDLFGTGDSEGEFRDATVERWIEDLAVAARHAEACGRPVRAILAVRLGCALAATAGRAGALPAVAASVWWQPVLDGKRHLAQFLRLRVAAGSMRGDDPETVDGLRSRSASGETIAVAGYELSSTLVRGLEALVTESLPPQAGELHWLEFVRDAEAAPPLPATRFVERARATGANASLSTCAAEPFWASAEIVRVPQAIERTAAILGGLPLASPQSPSTGSRVGR